MRETRTYTRPVEDAKDYWWGEGMYQIEFDEQNRILTTRCTGFWDVAEVERFGKELSATLRRLRAIYPTLSILSDSREMSLQGKEVAVAFAALSDDEAMRPTGRVAILVVRMLNKLQADRMADSPWVKVFFDEAEARAWLSAPAAG